MNLFLHSYYSEKNSILFQDDVNKYAVELALLILNLSKTEYNSMSEEEMKYKYQTCDKKEEILARDLLISDKKRQKSLFYNMLNPVPSYPPQYRSFRKF